MLPRENHGSVGNTGKRVKTGADFVQSLRQVTSLGSSIGTCSVSSEVRCETSVELSVTIFKF